MKMRQLDHFARHEAHYNCRQNKEHDFSPPQTTSAERDRERKKKDFTKLN